MKIHQKVEGRLEHRLLQGYDLKVVQKLHLLGAGQFADFVEEYCLQTPSLTLVNRQYLARESFDIEDKGSLYDYLAFQIEVDFDASEKKRAKEVAASLDHNGFYSGESCAIVAKMQRLAPVGIACKGPREALLVQLEEDGKKDTLAYLILQDTYPLFLKNDRSKLAKKWKASLAMIEEAVEQIKGYNPFPGRGFEETPTGHVVPEMILSFKKKWSLQFVKDFYPSCKLLKTGSLKQIDAAKKFIYQLHKRKNTLEQIVAFIVKKQHHFLLGRGEKVSIYREDLLKKLSISESSLSRILSDKYIDTPIGLHPLSFFFTRKTTSLDTDTSIEKAKQILKKLIEMETKPSPDQILSDLMKQEGILCSRRTVAKYRISMNIPSSHSR